MDGYKDWYKSKTVLASILGAVVSVLGVCGVLWKVDVDQLATALAVLLPLVVTLATSLVAWWGRLQAREAIGAPPAPPGRPSRDVDAIVRGTVALPDGP
jgi:hypothetical protein